MDSVVTAMKTDRLDRRATVVAKHHSQHDIAGLANHLTFLFLFLSFSQIIDYILQYIDATY